MFIDDIENIGFVQTGGFFRSSKKWEISFENFPRKESIRNVRFVNYRIFANVNTYLIIQMKNSYDYKHQEITFFTETVDEIIQIIKLTSGIELSPVKSP